MVYVRPNCRWHATDGLKGMSLDEMDKKGSGKRTGRRE